VTLRVGFDVRALDDLRDAEGRYESNPNFLAEVWRAVDLVADWPKAAPLVADPGPDEIRRVAVGRFPYGIVYIVLDDLLWIVALAHSRRRPGYWRDRLP